MGGSPTCEIPLLLTFFYLFNQVEFWCKKPNFLEFKWPTHVGVKVWWKGPEAAVFGHGPGGVKNRPVPTRIPALVPSLHLLTSAPTDPGEDIVRWGVWLGRHIC